MSDDRDPYGFYVKNGSFEIGVAAKVVLAILSAH